MAKKIVDRILPTTMVGSYPRPHWFKHQLLGRDVRVAFKEVQHEEAYDDAVGTVIRDQEDAGLDIVIDSHLDAVDQLADVVDGLEDDLFSDEDSTASESREVQLRSFSARKSLVRLRRVTAPMRELIDLLHALQFNVYLCSDSSRDFKMS